MRTRLVATVIGMTLGAVALAGVFAAPAGAAIQPPPPGAAPQASGPDIGPVKITGVGAGQSVQGYLSTLTPAQRLLGYPATVPQTGWTPKDEGFAGLIHMQVTSGPGAGSTFDAYCIDILTPTNIGFPYKQGEWNEANVPNVGYVARLLQSYSPTTSEPSNLAPNPRAAAVQAAIWFFSDGYVLSKSSSLYTTVAGIVANVIKLGPLNAPPPPNVTIDGPKFGGVGAVVGPFTIHTNGQTADARVGAGVNAFSDEDGTVSLGSTFTVTDGQKVWLQGSAAGAISLTVTATVTQPGGTVFLFVPFAGGPSDAQTIIQAGPLTAVADVTKTVVLFGPQDFTVIKSITGDGAGQQGEIRIDIVCSKPNGPIPPFIIPAGATGAVSTVVTGITVPAQCNLTESATGDNQVIDVFGPGGVSAQSALQATSVCPPESQQLLQETPPVTFVNVVNTTSPGTTIATTTTAGSTTTSGGSTSSSEETTTTAATTTAPTTTVPTTTAPTTTAPTTSGATTTAPTSSGATTTGQATTTASTTVAPTVAPSTVVPTTAPNECELSGSTTAPPTTGETLPATGSDSGGLGTVGIVGVFAGLALVAIASRRRVA